MDHTRTVAVLPPLPSLIPFFHPFGEILGTSNDEKLYIEFEDVVDADAAVDNMHESEVLGHVLRVYKATKTELLDAPIWS